MRISSRFAIVIVFLLLMTGCASEVDTGATTSPTPQASTTLSTAAAATSAATTSIATTTSALSLDEAVAAAFADRGFVPVIPNDTPMGFAETLCSRVGETDPGSGMYMENVALAIHRSAPDRIWETTALLVETVCPEHASALEFSSDDYAAARSVDLEVGDCVVMPAYGLVRRPIIPVECSEPHDGEVIALVDAEDRSFPADQPSILELTQSVMNSDCQRELISYIGGVPRIGLFSQVVADS